MFHTNKANTMETQQGEEGSSKKRLIIRIVIACMIVLLGIIMFVICKDAFYGLDNSGHPSLLKKKLVVYMGCFAIYVFSVIWKNRLDDLTNRIINIHLIEWVPFICFVAAETLMGTGSDLTLKRVILNVLMYMVVYYLVYALTADLRIAIITLSVFTTLFAVANIYLIRFRQIPLLFSDLTVVKTAMNVAGDFDYTPNVDIILLLCFLIAMIALSLKVVQPKELKKKVSFRVTVGVCYLLFLGIMAQLTVRSGFLSKNHINVNTFRPIKSYKKNGGLLTFARSIRLCMVKKPDGYSVKSVEEIAKDYSSDSVDMVDDNKQPNVIVIMDEAFADLQSVGEFETNEEVLPFYNSMKENTIKGFTYVSVFGGQTANTEYEFLTGDSKAFLPKGSTPYQLYIKEFLPSLTGNLALDGYQGLLALHPFRATGYNRINVYNNLGFSDFITMDEFHNPSYVRGFISDEADFDRVISEYEKCKEESDAPFYMFNVTMQNHSSYSADYENLPKTIKITTPGKSDAAAERYLNLIHLSDQAIEKLIDYFEKQDEPTVIVLFGDHEPGLSDAFYETIMDRRLNSLTAEESMELYKTPFFIWANFDIEEKYIDRVSINYLQSLMVDAVGLEKTGYNKFLLDLYEAVPVITGNGYFGADGMYYDIEDKESPYYELIHEYNILEYNHMFDSKHRNELFEYSK